MSKRSKAKVYVSKKQIVDIKEFIELYVGKAYTWSLKLTHNNMEWFLREKGKVPPRRVDFEDVDKENLLNGNLITVKDEEGKVLIYKNPRITLTQLQEELNMFYNEEEMKKRIENALASVEEKVLVKRRVNYDKH